MNTTNSLKNVSIMKYSNQKRHALVLEIYNTKVLLKELKNSCNSTTINFIPRSSTSILITNGTKTGPLFVECSWKKKHTSIRIIFNIRSIRDLIFHWTPSINYILNNRISILSSLLDAHLFIPINYCAVTARRFMVFLQIFAV